MGLDPSPRVLVLVRTGANKLCWVATSKLTGDKEVAPESIQVTEAETPCLESIKDRLYALWISLSYPVSSIAPLESLQKWLVERQFEKEDAVISAQIDKLQEEEKIFLYDCNHGYSLSVLL